MSTEIHWLMDLSVLMNVSSCTKNAIKCNEKQYTKCTKRKKRV